MWVGRAGRARGRAGRQAGRACLLRRRAAGGPHPQAHRSRSFRAWRGGADNKGYVVSRGVGPRLPRFRRPCWRGPPAAFWRPAPRAGMPPHCTLRGSHIHPRAAESPLVGGNEGASARWSLGRGTLPAEVLVPAWATVREVAFPAWRPDPRTLSAPRAEGSRTPVGTPVEHE